MMPQGISKFDSAPPPVFKLGREGFGKILSGALCRPSLIHMRVKQDMSANLSACEHEPYRFPDAKSSLRLSTLYSLSQG